MIGKPETSLASMGIYVFSVKFLIDQLKRDAEDPDSSHDFGKDIIPYLVKNGKAVAHPFTRSCRRSGYETEDYWRDVGTVDAYYEANIDLTLPLPALDFYEHDWPIWTYAEITPPAKFVHDQEGRRGQAFASLVSGGCIISGGTVRNSLLFSNARLHSYCQVESAVILPNANIARGARLTRVIVEKGVQIPPGLVVGEDPVEDAKRFRLTEKGIVLITQPMIDRLGL
jgi:glucose-1-phosphate adenylyltransferase